MVKTLPPCEVAEMSHQEIAEICRSRWELPCHVWPEPEGSSRFTPWRFRFILSGDLSDHFQMMH